MFNSNATRLFTITSFGAILAILVACGGDSTAAPTPPTSTPRPVATFQSIQVTAVPDATATPEPTTEADTPTKGVPKPFPEVLSSAEQASLGTLLSTWETYLENTVLEFEDNAWDLCGAARGYAAGSLFNGNLLWSMGPARFDFEVNEIALEVYEVETRGGMRYAVGYRNGQPVLRPANYNPYSGDPTEFLVDPIPFQAYELNRCVNIGGGS
jgi:hypothetical protein